METATAHFTLALLGPAPAVGLAADLTCQALVSWQQWNTTSAPVLLINLPEREQDGLLMLLRADSKRYRQPIFCVNASPLAPMLADGLLAQLSERAPVILERLALINVHDHPDELEKLAWFGWPRPHFQLLPQWQPAARQGYGYPLLDCLFAQKIDLIGRGDPNQGVHASHFLPQLVGERVLEISRLVDRVRLCGHCHGGHLNFIDVCPACRHIAIEAKPAVHCFTCGHVEDQDKFMQQGSLRCPKCVTQLRHIGVDYDRPLEKYHCQSCHARFMEAAVEARCHACGQAHQPDNLLVAPVYEYSLGQLARHIAREGTQQLQVPLTWGRDVPMEHFPWLLQWTNSLLERHGGVHSLLAIKVERLAQLRAQLGLIATGQRLAALLTRLQALFRDTDVVCQYGENGLVLLLPYTDEPAQRLLQERVAALNEVEGLDVLSLAMKGCTLPQALGEDVQAWLQQWLSHDW
ncbi:MAG: diguanylate cyclase domain-containing protein [Aeromonas sp.]